MESSSLARRAPGHEVARGARALPLQLVERRHRVLPETRRVRKFGRLDHFLQHGLDLFRLALLQPFQHAQQIDVARGVRGKREPRHAADCKLFDTVALFRPRKQCDDLRDRSLLPRREIDAPKCVDEVGVRTRRRSRRLGGSALALKNMSPLKKRFILSNVPGRFVSSATSLSGGRSPDR